jgi:hypothetical protein
MSFQGRRSFEVYAGLILILAGLLAACGARVSDLQVVDEQGPAVDVTLTPFQPQFEGGDPGVQAVAPLTGPTYTPYPTSRASSEGPSGGLEILPNAPADPLVVYNPLTGLPVNDPSLLERRPMVIKVANAPDYVRPQSGLTLADQVYEYYIEWGDTRFIAVMYGNDSPFVGPVRSGRYFDEHVARMYNAFLVFKFADPREFDYLKGSTLNEFLVVPGSSACPPFVLGPQARDAYNNIFFNTARWAACAAKKGVDNSIQPLRRGFFAEGFPDSDLVATRVFTHYSIYSYNYWDYDPVTHKYFRYQEANDMINGQPEAYVPLSDAQTGMPVTADNVVVIFVPYTFANQFDAHDEVYHIDLIDSGNAYVFRDGLAIPAVWNRLEEDQPILLTTTEGDPIYMHPGRTFYEVIGTSSVQTREGTEWKFRFSTP